MQPPAHYSGTTRSGSFSKIPSKEKRGRVFSEINGRMNVVTRSEPNFSSAVKKSVEDDTAEKYKGSKFRRHSVASKYASPRAAKKILPTVSAATPERSLSMRRPSTPGAGSDTSKNVSKVRISNTGETGSRAPTMSYWGSSTGKSSNRRMVPSSGRSNGDLQQAGGLLIKSKSGSRSLDTALPRKPDRNPPADAMKHLKTAHPSLLKSASYWLEQVKHAEAIQKHALSLGFFRLAVECDPEPFQMLRDELISYKQRYALCSKGVTQILSCYGITEEGHKLSAREQAQRSVLDGFSCTLDSLLCSSVEQKAESHPTSNNFCASQPSSSTFGIPAGCMSETAEIQQMQNTEAPLENVDVTNGASNHESELHVQSVCKDHYFLAPTSKRSGESDILAHAKGTEEQIKTAAERQLCKSYVPQPETQQCRASVQLSTFQSSENGLPQSCEDGLLSPVEVKRCTRNNLNGPPLRCTPRRECASSAAIPKLERKETKLSARKTENGKTREEIKSSEGLPAGLASVQYEVMDEQKHLDALNLAQMPVDIPAESSTIDQPRWFGSSLVATSIGPIETMDVDSMMNEVVSGIMLSMDDANDFLTGKGREVYSGPYKKETTLVDKSTSIDVEPNLHLAGHSYTDSDYSAVSANNHFASDRKAEYESINEQANTVASSTEQNIAFSSFFEGVNLEQEAAYNGSEPSLDIWNPSSFKERMEVSERMVLQEDEAQSSQTHLLLCDNTEMQFENELTCDDDTCSILQESAGTNLSMFNSALNAQTYAPNGRRKKEQKENRAKVNESSDAGLHGVALSSCETALSLEKPCTYPEIFCSNKELGSIKDCLTKEEMASTDSLSIEHNKPLVHSAQNIGTNEYINCETPIRAQTLSSSLRTPSSRRKPRTLLRRDRSGTNESMNTKISTEDPSPSTVRMARTSLGRTGATEEAKLSFPTRQSRASPCNQSSPSAGGSARGRAKRGMHEEKPGKQVLAEGSGPPTDMRNDNNSQSIGTPGSTGLRRSARLRAASPATTPHT